MTDDEIIAVRKSVKAADFEKRWPDSLAFGRAVANAAIEECAKVCEQAYGGKAHTYASENADRYRAQDDATRLCARRVRALAKS